MADTTQSKPDNVAIIGSGSWGTAITRLVAPHARTVSVWSHDAEVAASITECHRNPHQIPFFEVPGNVVATTDMVDAVEGADALLIAVPSAYLRDTLHELARAMRRACPVLVLTKGIEAGTGRLMSEVAEEELGHDCAIAVLTGPNHAEEVALGKISAAVIAAPDLSVAAYFQRLVECREFRVYVTRDVAGVECCAAAKNVVAIACGIAWAAGAGDNTLAALMTRGLAEIGRITAALGGDPITCMGLAGMGDLVATCTSRHSRNRTFGEAFVAGESLAAYERRTGMVVEGARAAASIREVADARGIEVPITRAVFGVLFEGIPLAEAMDGLLGRISFDEFYDVR